MYQNKIKELFKEEKYSEVIALIKQEYVELFKKMLDYKGSEYNENENFKILAARIPLVYSQYSDKMVRLNNLLFDPEEGYLDVINSMLSIYESLSNTYKDI